MTMKLEGGRRTRVDGLPPERGERTVSVVTIVRNGESYVEATLRSVVDQSYPSIELIIIDGGSADGTVDVISKYDDRANYWVSEPDGGIYDAMNKGAALATGDWLCFLNAGDVFAANDSVEKILAGVPPRTELIYGDCEVDYGGFQKRLTAGSVTGLWKGMVFSHQSLLARRHLVRSNPFDSRDGLAADFGFVLKMHSEGRAFHHSKSVLARVSALGVSDEKRGETLRSTFSIVKRYKKGPATRAYFLARLATELAKTALKVVLGKSVVRLVQRYQSQ